MRHALIACGVLLSIAGAAAFAEETRSPASNADVMLHYYPPAAQAQGVEGVATLCCAIEPDGRLSCSSPYEWPEGYGFGQASVSVSRHFRVSPPVDGSPRTTTALKRIIRWVLPGSPPQQDFEAALGAAREMTCEAAPDVIAD